MNERQSNKDMAAYIFKTRQIKPNCSEKITNFVRPKGLLSDGHISAMNIENYNKFILPKQSHNQNIVKQNTMNDKKIYALPQKNVTSESELLKGTLNTMNKSDMTDNIINNQRYQMSNFSPIIDPRNQNANINMTNFSTIRGGISTRLQKYK